MSGFAGIVRLEPTLETAEADRATIARMAQAIAFRGPDAQRQWHRDGASFAFSLLTTGPAPQSASQPVTLDGETWLLGDVRLDRRTELIEALNRAGYPCGPIVTDEEIVLLAWKRWRAEETDNFFQEELHGDFAFAVWEPGRKELNCFRDLIGCRPFYYTTGNNAFFFSNTLACLKHSPDFQSGLDRRYIGDFLLLAECPDPERTIFSWIRRLPAGHQMTVSRTGIRLRRLQQLPIEQPLRLKDDAEYIDEFRSLLQKSVADRLPAAPVAFFLSGGMDSGSLAATACALRRTGKLPESIFAFMADQQPLFEDREGEWARETAEFLGLDLQVSHHGDTLPFNGFCDWPQLFPEPFANPFRAIYLHLYRQSATAARVIIMGYGGDDAIAGAAAASYFVFLVRNRGLFSAFKEFGRYAIQHRSLPPPRAGLRRRLSAVFHRREHASPPRWLNSEFARQFDLSARWRELTRDTSSAHPIHPRAYHGLMGTGWSNILEKEDAAYNGLPLELRLPFFDYRLLRFALRLPVLPWCIDKEILRRAMRGRLPSRILQRPKTVLVQDPLRLHHERGTWRPERFASPAPEIGDFVDWRAVLEDIRTGAAIWREVSPVALNLWLKSR